MTSSSSLRNPLALLAFSALCVVSAVALLLTGHPVPVWLQTLCAAGLVGGAGVMTPGLPTIEKLLGGSAAVSSLLAVSPVMQQARRGNTGPPTIGLTATDLEPVAP